MTRPARRVLLALAFVAGTGGRVPAETVQRPGAVLVFAAASLQTVLDEMAPAIARSTGVRVVTSYAASSALARQIEAGAPADLFLSADREWMDYVRERHLVRAASIVDLAGNRLVLIAPAGARTTLRIGPRFPLAAALGSGRLAIAEPTSVPAGRYARAALTTLGIWEAVSSRIAPAEHVRAALLLVARGETPFGIVYRTDAIAEPAVSIVDTFPDDTHPPIAYPVAVTATAGPDAARVLAYLKSAEATATFARHGFVTF